MDCHNKHEIHGDGILYKEGNAVKERPSCRGCHKPGQESCNPFHDWRIPPMKAGSAATGATPGANTAIATAATWERAPLPSRVSCLG